MDGEVVVARFDAPHEAELAAIYLREHGVSARVDNDVLVGMNPLWGTALGGVRLYVAESKAQSAFDLLEGLKRSTPAPDDDDDDDDDPEAAVSDRTREIDKVANRALLAALLGVFMLPIIANIYSLVLALPLSNALLSPRGRRDQAIAVTIDVAVIGLVAYLVISGLRGE